MTGVGRRRGRGVWEERPGEGERQQPMTRQRARSSQRFSNRLRFVTRGGEGRRNISVLNGVTSRVVRRMR